MEVEVGRRGAVGEVVEEVGAAVRAEVEAGVGKDKGMERERTSRWSDVTSEVSSFGIFINLDDFGHYMSLKVLLLMGAPAALTLSYLKLSY